MPDIAANIITLKKQLPPSVKIIAVSKTRSEKEIIEAYNSGQRMFGENRVQELINKREKLPGDIEWHLIGHLQSNKVRYISPFISMIQSVDSSKILELINNEAIRANRKIDCLLQFHIAQEESKSGFSIDEAEDLINSSGFNSLKNVGICGVMGMATFTDNENIVRQEFRNLAGYFHFLKEKYFSGQPSFREISMGMSGDYRIAIEEGSTMIRTGSIIFGDRK